MAKTKKVKTKDKASLMLNNLSKKTDKELRQILDKFYEEEEKLSYRRRILHGKIDIVRAELVERLKGKHQAGESIVSARDLKRLSEILARTATGVSKVDLSDEDVLE